MAHNSKADDLEGRLVQFAIEIIKLVDQLPDGFGPKHVATQMLRSGTSPAPNYGEARAAESRADFVHKLKIALKELNETAIWLRILQGSFAVNPDFLDRLVAENRELCRIMVASIQTARRNDAKMRNEN